MLKRIGASGQITLGKKFAGRTVLIESTEPGVWSIKLGTFVPDNEKWILAPGVIDDIEEAAEYASKHKPRATNLDSFAAKHGLKEKNRGK